MRGSSGAVLEIGARQVKKWGPAGTIGPRILEQGKFLLEIQGKGVVRVGELLDSGMQLGYTMEHLTVPPIELLDTKTVLRRIVVCLCDHVWCSFNDLVQYDPIAHRKRMDPLWDYAGKATSALPAILEDLESWFIHEDVRACRTHGDSIIDNVLLRGEDVVITDPIRATPAIPDLRCVDIGRLIQSAVGYERVRYDLRGPAFLNYDAVREIVADYGNITYEEWVCSVYWACCHLLRSMHYVDDPVRKALVRECYLPLLDQLQQLNKEMK